MITRWEVTSARYEPNDLPFPLPGTPSRTRYNQLLDDGWEPFQVLPDGFRGSIPVTHCHFSSKPDL